MKTGAFSFEIAILLPKEGVKIIEDISFNVKFENSLFIKKLELDLSHIVFDIEGFKTYIPNTFEKEPGFTE